MDVSSREHDRMALQAVARAAHETASRDGVSLTVAAYLEQIADALLVQRRRSPQHVVRPPRE